MKKNILSRRNFLQTGVIGLAIPILNSSFCSFLSISESKTTERDFSISLTPDEILRNPDLVKIIAKSGVNRIWIITFCYGYWPWSMETIKQAHHAVMSAGLISSALTLPLGHPGDALGAKDGDFNLNPPSHWPGSKGINGNIYTGTTVSLIATNEIVNALKELHSVGFKKCMLDDDFRIARQPGVIGGNYDDASKITFIKTNGLNESDWGELLNDIKQNKFTPLLRLWINWQCDFLTKSFLEQRKSFHGELGLMVMYLGAEKAGIRLSDYKNIPFRVGEYYFNDELLSVPKGWTDELFSVLFHRRYVSADNSWSETTAFPANALSANNIAAKLVISTIADVRHTTFMSGLTPFPQEYWDILSPAMKRQKELHKVVAGHSLKGPLKHFWGVASRYIGKDNPYSLWLSLGIPFEVISEINSTGNNGWIFLSNEDCAEAQNHKDLSHFIARPEALLKAESVIHSLNENLTELWKWKQSILTELQAQNVPYIMDMLPCVCAWYPDANCVLIWNLSNSTQKLTLHYKANEVSESFLPLEAKILSLKKFINKKLEKGN